MEKNYLIWAIEVITSRVGDIMVRRYAYNDAIEGYECSHEITFEVEKELNLEGAEVLEMMVDLQIESEDLEVQRVGEKVYQIIILV